MVCGARYLSGRMQWDINYPFGTLMRTDNYPRMRRDYQLCWGVLPVFTINQIEVEFFFERSTIDAYRLPSGPLRLRKL